MSRGGTRKARARQDEVRRSRQRKARAAVSTEAKAKRKARARHGRGRAAILHLSGFAAPLVLAFGLLRSGQASNSTSAYWLGDLIDDANTSYFREPVGLLYTAVIFTLTVATFVVLPVWLWRRLYRSHDVLLRDRTSVDSAYTLVVITALVWVFRIVVGYSDSIAGFALIMSILSVYVPVFSAILAISMPVVPGSGRIGGILPNFLRMGFTERYLLSDEEKEQLADFEKAKEEAKA
jgi:hypothetical protein